MSESESYAVIPPLALSSQLDSRRRLLTFFPNDTTLKYWHDRLSEIPQPDETRGSKLFPLALVLVALENEYLIRQNLSESQKFRQQFEDLIGSDATKALDLTSVPDSAEEREAENKIATEKGRIGSRYLKYESIVVKRFFDLNVDIAADRNMEDLHNTLQYVTVQYVANKCTTILLKNEAFSHTQLMNQTNFVHMICLKYLPKAPQRDFANHVRHVCGSAFLNCALQRGIDEHRCLVKAFQYFESMIDRQRHPHLIRRVDNEIVVSEVNIESILKLATIFVELRQSGKSRDLINIARTLIAKLPDDDDKYKLFFGAYADYIQGLGEFEETSPLMSKLNASSGVIDPDTLKSKYGAAKDSLEKCLIKLEANFPNLPLTASALTMMGIVCVNDAGDFVPNGGLQYLDRAVAIESTFSTPTRTMSDLVQILKVGFKVSTTERAREMCLSLLNKVSPSMNPANEQVTSESSPSSASDIFQAVGDARQFIDGYQHDSLAHWKEGLRNGLQEENLLFRMLYTLLISRHYLRSHYLMKAECRQNKVARFMLISFGLKLKVGEQLNRHVDTFRQTLPDKHKELTYLTVLWLINQGMLALGKSMHKYQKKCALEVVKKWRQNESQLAKLSCWVSYARNRFGDKRDKDWYRAHSCFEYALEMFNRVLRPNPESREKPALIFLEQYLAEAYYRLNDVIAFDDQYKTDVKLVAKIVELLEDAHKLDDSEESGQFPVQELMNSLNASAVNLPQLSLRLNGKIRYESRGKTFDLLNRLGVFRKFDIVVDMTQPRDKLKQLQGAYDLCYNGNLIDTELYALVHMLVGIQLLRSGEMNPFKPHYANFNAAIHKFRKAARILELLCGNDARTAHCYSFLSVLYCTHMQVEDQEARCLQCLEKCASIERSLIVKEATPSPWLWKCLDVANDCRTHFYLTMDESDQKANKQSDSNWSQLFSKLLITVTRDTPIYTMPDCFRRGQHGTLNLLTETLTDPLAEWEEKRNLSLKGIAVMFKDRAFPEDSLPSETEIRCYSSYLNKLFNQHWDFCRNPNSKCVLESEYGIVRHDFLSGIRRYSASSKSDKKKILSQLQRNHNALLRVCKSAQRYHDSYRTGY